MINTVTIAGNLTRDPELRSMSSGLDVLEFSVAVNDRKKKGEEWVDDPSYFDCVLYGRKAQSLNDHLSKGRKVTVSGKLKQDRWQDSQGQNRSKVRIVASEVEYMDSGKVRENVQSDDDLADEDIPF